MARRYPTFAELPIQAGAPAGSAWGVFDEECKKDVYGTLNFITPQTVVAAKAEIVTGEQAVLNLPLHLPHNACSPRISTKHTLIDNQFGMFCCDDELHINTQSTSQWDGLLHFAHQERQEYYNGVKYADAAEGRTDESLGIQALSERGGLAGRGVLVDFVRYAARKQIEYDPLSNYAITLSQIKEILDEQQVQLRPGDVLLIRSGLSKWIRASSPESPGPFAQPSKSIGVDPTLDLLALIWDSRLAAVGGDAIAFEAVPASDGSFMKLHTACLSGWGMMIGELLDLEKLSEIAEANQRWTFFLTACPLNIKGGASTTSNTLAIF